MAAVVKKRTHLRGDAMRMNRRELLAVGLGLNLTTAVALARQGGATVGSGGGARSAGVPARTAKTTRMFKSPGLYPNALAVMTDPPGGLWIGQQKVTAASAKTYNLLSKRTPKKRRGWSTGTAS